MSFRIENKYRLSKGDLARLLANLNNSNPKTLYPDRKVTSCYFDSNDFLMFHQSEEGVLPRKKIRARRYNDGNQFTKEVKISSIEGRYKTSELIKDVSSLSQILDMQIMDQDYGILLPSMFVSYRRSYIKIAGLRCTLDRDIEYKNLRNRSGLKFYDDECVFEVKADFKTSKDFIEKIFPMSTSRFSKYSRAIIKFYQH